MNLRPEHLELKNLLRKYKEKYPGADLFADISDVSAGNRRKCANVKTVKNYIGICGRNIHLTKR